MNAKIVNSNSIGFEGISNSESPSISMRLCKRDIRNVKFEPYMLVCGPVDAEFVQPGGEAVLANLCKAIEHTRELFEFGVHPAD
jgi:hypothetical protein